MDSGLGYSGKKWLEMKREILVQVDLLHVIIACSSFTTKIFTHVLVVFVLFSSLVSCRHILGDGAIILLRVEQGQCLLMHN